ncbi:MAG TPA: antitoxin Xre/MbcA/ParS toxin-binding domain-containing protein [Candidatus Eremiobacteraceae bacterium]|nr:antitoxin Xre/MbcA/ParS toxin-binding domain-containing protein [Candidatus Eremiobacteraceae bacterium]
MSLAKNISHMLGGPDILKARINGDADLEAAVTTGFPTAAVRALAERTRSSLSFLQDVTGLDKNTFRRRERSKSRLRAEESDRLARVARIAALATEAMGADDGVAWLHEPNRSLGDRIPMEMLHTEIGARQVEDVLMRIQHGVYS